MDSETIERSGGDLLGDSETYCMRCGHQYDWRGLNPPEEASIYWEPHCPVCNAKMTGLPTDEEWLEIVSDPFDGEVNVERLHFHARLVHGRLAGLTVEELIDRAKFFDRKQKHRSWSLDRYHRIAFRLRQQAREKLQEDDSDE